MSHTEFSQEPTQKIENQILAKKTTAKIETGKLKRKHKLIFTLTTEMVDNFFSYLFFFFYEWKTPAGKLISFLFIFISLFMDYILVVRHFFLYSNEFYFNSQKLF